MSYGMTGSCAVYEERDCEKLVLTFDENPPVCTIIAGVFWA